MRHSGHSGVAPAARAASSACVQPRQQARWPQGTSTACRGASMHTQHSSSGGRWWWPAPPLPACWWLGGSAMAPCTHGGTGGRVGCWLTAADPGADCTGGSRCCTKAGPVGDPGVAGSTEACCSALPGAAALVVACSGCMPAAVMPGTCTSGCRCLADGAAAPAAACWPRLLQRRQQAPLLPWLLPLPPGPPAAAPRGPGLLHPPQLLPQPPAGGVQPPPPAAAAPSAAAASVLSLLLLLQPPRPLPCAGRGRRLGGEVVQTWQPCRLRQWQRGRRRRRRQ